jgi:hypothetical protein
LPAVRGTDDGDDAAFEYLAELRFLAHVVWLTGLEVWGRDGIVGFVGPGGKGEAAVEESIAWVVWIVRTRKSRSRTGFSLPIFPTRPTLLEC